MSERVAAAETSARDGAARGARWTVLALLILVPAARLPAGAPGAASELFRAGLLGSLAVFGLSLLVLAGGAGLLWRSPLARPALGLLLVLLVSSAVARASVAGLFETGRIATLTLVAVLASVAVASDARFARRALWALGLGTGLAVLTGAFGERGDLGTLAAVGLVGVLALDHRGLGEWLLGIAFLALLALSQAPWAWLATGLALAAWTWHRRGSRRAIAIAVLAIGLAAVVVRQDRAPEVRSSAAAARRAAVALGLSRPLLGHGPGSFSAEAGGVVPAGPAAGLLDARSDPLQAFAETGVFGVLALTAGLVAVASSASRAAAGGGLPWWAFGLLAAVLHGCFHRVLASSAPALVAMVAAGLSAPAPGPGPGPGSAGGRARLGLVLPLAGLLLMALRPAVAAALFMRMEREFASHDYDAAAIAAERSLRFHPVRVEPARRLAEIHLLADDWRAALSWTERGLALAPHDPALHLRAAQANFFLGQRERARAALTRALDLAPADPEILDWHERIGRPELARPAPPPPRAPAAAGTPAAGPHPH